MKGWIIRGLILTGIVLGLCGFGENRALKAEVTRCRGKIQWRPTPQAEWKSLRKGHRLAVGQYLRTQDDAQVELQVENVYIRLLERSVLRVRRIERRDDSVFVETELELGGLWGKVVKTFQNLVEFKVETPMAITAVKGTAFKLTAEENCSILTVVEGSVEIFDRMDHRVQAVANERWIVDQKGINRSALERKDLDEMREILRWGRFAENFVKKTMSAHENADGVKGRGGKGSGASGGSGGAGCGGR